MKICSIKTVFGVSLALSLCGCAAEIQQMPILVGQKDGRALFSFRGFTPLGKTTYEDARQTAQSYLPWLCKDGEPSLVDVQTSDALKPMGGQQLGWMATYTCGKASQ
ncbi:hypothetical protein J2848_003049 [Azospirillum lipoferum]|uniref:Lipoprotein n=1 Tax=Azospirillum lipoferum TaxID=193 RepID=A0A5A9GN03_AZOLI|nr:MULTISPECIES: hypothetical protein [Azospirillum]KAA0595753.1 hypothetical protein FZ942_15280 [Azospirillum lipoferum]MCP1611376.1 hypothetical protein [Azospirillum lipoferum]MDW5537179.1 hypothetical protein [Azospirillum sp. NL1]